MSCNYTFFKDIIIPLIAALIGGGTTLIGVICTIRHENKKSDDSYKERIRPFFVVESPSTSSFELEAIKTAVISDDSANDVAAKDIILHWGGLLLTNVGEAVCVFEYIRIDNVYYEAGEKTPVKTGVSLRINSSPLSMYIRNGTVSQIAIGMTDRLFNRYEYLVSFKLIEYRQEGPLKEHTHKSIEVTEIDCSKNVFSEKKYKKGRKVTS